MTNQQTSRAAQHAKGSVKEAIGKLTGDRRVQSEGATEKAEAQAQMPTNPIADDSQTQPSSSKT
jgi:uncharacterized protein YjbJ (UPF0337 family)